MTSPQDPRTLDGHTPSGAARSGRSAEKELLRAAAGRPGEVDGRPGTVAVTAVTAVDRALNRAEPPGPGPAVSSPGPARPRARRPAARAGERGPARRAPSARPPVRFPDADGGFAPFRNDHRAPVVPGLLAGIRAAGGSEPGGPVGSR